MITTKIDAGILTITIPVDAATVRDARPSTTGKTRIVASTAGFTRLDVPGLATPLSLNLTVTAKA